MQPTREEMKAKGRKRRANILRKWKTKKSANAGYTMTKHAKLYDVSTSRMSFILKLAEKDMEG